MQVLYTVVTAFLLAQTLKILWKAEKDHVIKVFFTGGMPSVHCATTSSLFFSILFTQGFTPLAVTSMILFFIVFCDAIGVRRMAGEEAEALDKIAKKEKLHLHIHKALGHKPTEAVAGTLIGLGVAIVFLF